jgi:hypothetical protein
MFLESRLLDGNPWPVIAVPIALGSAFWKTHHCDRPQIAPKERLALSARVHTRLLVAHRRTEASPRY